MEINMILFIGGVAEMNMIHFIGEVATVIVLLITIFSLYGKVIKDYTRLKTSVEMDILMLKNEQNDIKIDIVGLQSAIQSSRNEWVKDHKIIMSEIRTLDVKNIEANQAQFKELTAFIDLKLTNIDTKIVDMNDKISNLK